MLFALGFFILGACVFMLVPSQKLWPCDEFSSLSVRFVDFLALNRIFIILGKAFSTVFILVCMAIRGW